MKQNTKKIENATYEQLVEVYRAAYIRRDPCTLCGRQHPKHHHADVWGRNICHYCYKEMDGKVCVQHYPGDFGGSIGPFQMVSLPLHWRIQPIYPCGPFGDLFEAVDTPIIVDQKENE